LSGLWDHQVEQHQVGFVGLKSLQRHRAVTRLDYAIPLLLELIGKFGAQRLLVLDDQNGAGPRDPITRSRRS
jgi:hypothetical protein